MDLRTKKELAARTLGVSKERIVFLAPRAEEIKEAITKQDIRDLHKDGAIVVKDIKGRKKVKKKRNRSTGNVRKKVRNRKAKYIVMTRKLRTHTEKSRKKGEINKEDSIEIRKKIRNKIFRSGAHLKEYIGGLHK